MNSTPGAPLHSSSQTDGSDGSTPLPPSPDAVKILLVEDNIDHLFLTRRELETHLSCQIITAQSAEEALAIIQQYAGQNQPDFDVVLVDNGLPRMSGLDMLAQLRAQGDSTPVIIVAGQGSETIAVEALRRGAADYVVKSGDYAALFPRVIAQVVERVRMQRRNEHLEAEHIRFARLAAIGESATGIAHEIRNPLTVISGMAGMIRDYAGQLSAEEINKCARTIAENCDHLNRVLEEVLHNAQPSQQQEPLLVAEVLDETLSFMRFDPTFRHRMQIEPDFRTSGLVMGSRDQLKQVFINLFRNAAQAVQLAGKERGTLRVRLEEVVWAGGEDDGNKVEITVEDNGDGIPAEVLPQIFESGFTTKRNRPEVEGNGLGLSISRRIIESHSGHIWAEPRAPGHGAVFHIVLPSQGSLTSSTPAGTTP